MQSFKDFDHYIQNYTCPICQENINKHWKIITPCNHIFHKKCYKNSLSKCPICRKNTFNLDNTVYYKKIINENYLLNLEISKYKVEESMNLHKKQFRSSCLYSIYFSFLVFVIIKCII